MSRDDIREKALKQTKQDLKDSVDQDKFIVKSMKILNQLNSTKKSEMETFRDMYALHFPELEDEITDDEELLKILEKDVRREELEMFEEMAENSTGGDLNEEEEKLLRESLDLMQQKKDLSSNLENYIENAAEENMPNLSRLLEPLLAAKLMAHVGSLEDFAKKPASTVQMLGAEKALFRYLRGTGTPPKHGVIFEHRFVSTLPEEKRGKMARFLANKAVMTARLDYYGDKDKGDELRKEAQEKFEELKE